jgi:predicted O-linked N-acetylglucosamine transferase (SPINDLY family)
MGLDDPSRIVFTNPVARRIHLQVKALADVFVDTPQYNGHGTATDALWAGVLGYPTVLVCVFVCVCVF